MDRVTATLLAAVSVVLIGGFVLLTLTGHDTGSYALFLGGPAVSAVIGAVLVKRTAAVQADVTKVKTATDGLLTARFAHQDQRMDDASVERQDIAAAADTDRREIADRGHPV
jgi:hypothetical protein